MTTGDLIERVRIEAPVEVRDARGQPKQDGNWQPVCVVWAAVRSGTPREVWQGREVQQDGAETVTIRHRDDVAVAGGKWRVVILTQGNRVLNIEGPRRDPGRVWLHLVCRTEGRVTE